MWRAGEDGFVILILFIRLALVYSCITFSLSAYKLLAQFPVVMMSYWLDH